VTAVREEIVRALIASVGVPPNEQGRLIETARPDEVVAAVKRMRDAALAEPPSLLDLNLAQMRHLARQGAAIIGVMY
jgi:hypothetical protein